jgi:putative nucleotidyltransferase with HDIG domain
LAETGYAQIEGIQSCCIGCPACSARTDKTLLLSRLDHQDRTYGVLGLTLPDGVSADEEELALFREVSGDVAFALSLIEADEARERDREALAASHLKIRQAQEGTIAVLAKAVETRDPYTAGHQERVARLAQALAGRLGLSEAETEAVFFAARLHDIGKIRVPSEILNKPGRLSELEFAIVREHADAGWTILKDNDFPWPVAEIVRQHHERLDGSGYPRGLKGGEIGRAARIIAVADVVEAMTSHRPYRPAPGLAAALEEVEAHRGSRYDGKVVDACLDLFRQGFRFDEDGLNRKGGSQAR